MGIDKATPRTVLCLAAAAVLALPATLLSVVSWAARQGAVMEMTGVRHGEAG